jgi:hypothetical protein
MAVPHAIFAKCALSPASFMPISVAGYTRCDTEKIPMVVFAQDYRVRR